MRPKHPESEAEAHWLGGGFCLRVFPYWYLTVPGAVKTPCKLIFGQVLSDHKPELPALFGGILTFGVKIPCT